jgi:predicted restriction endonuclease
MKFTLSPKPAHRISKYTHQIELIDLNQYLKTLNVTILQSEIGGHSTPIIYTKLTSDIQVKTTFECDVSIAVEPYTHHKTLKHSLTFHGLKKFLAQNYGGTARNELRVRLLLDPVDFTQTPTTPFSPLDSDDNIDASQSLSELERELVQTTIRRRRGAKKFRDSLLAIYKNQCPVTESRLRDVLEAAHIKPYMHEQDNHSGNGILLRADIHTLFDLDILGLKPLNNEIEIHINTIRS